MQIQYVTDQFIPTDATDTIQLVTMAAALGSRGANLTLVFPVPRNAHWGSESIPDRQRLADYYGVSPTFQTMPLAGPYPAPFKFRGVEKIFHAGRAASVLGREDRARSFGAPQEHGVIYTRNLPVVLAALAGTKLPVFYETYRPWPRQSTSKRVLFKTLRQHPRFAGLILHSQLAARSYEEIGYENARLLVAHNAVNPGRFEALPSKDQLRIELGIQRDVPIALYAGHVSPSKGLGIILDAASALPDLKFIMVGSTGQTAIERRAASMANVTVVGWQPPDRIERWLKAADILLIPPTRGPLDRIGNTVLPIKTFQYLAAGRAIVAPSTEDLCEVLENDVNSVLVPPDDVEAFTRALRLVSHDLALVQRLSRDALAAGMRNSWEQRAERVLKFLSMRVTS